MSTIEHMLRSAPHCSVQCCCLDDGFHILVLAHHVDDGAYAHVPRDSKELHFARALTGLLQKMVHNLRSNGGPPGEGALRKKAAVEQMRKAQHAHDTRRAAHKLQMSSLRTYACRTAEGMAMLQVDEKTAAVGAIRDMRREIEQRRTAADLGRRGLLRLQSHASGRK